MNELVIPEYGRPERRVSRFPMPGFLSIVCFGSLWVWKSLADLIPDSVVVAGFLTLPVAGLFMGIAGLICSRSRSILAWIGIILNFLVLGLILIFWMYGPMFV